MSAAADALKLAIEEGRLGDFLKIFEKATVETPSDTTIYAITRRLLPAALLAWFEKERVGDAETIRLWKLVASGRLIIVENEVLQGINDRLSQAWKGLHREEPAPAPLRLFVDHELPAAPRRRELPPGKDPEAIEMKRVTINSTFLVGMAHVSDVLSFKRNVCASTQERVFLKSIRQFFPNLHAYPNVPLRNFLDLDGFLMKLSDRHHGYARSAEVDILLCTDDEDPVAGIELDSDWHDDEAHAERDKLKNQLFMAAGMPLVRIRPRDTRAVQPEDFYDLLVAHADALDRLRPRRLRPRRAHDSLIPV
jgi:hypothetical protein